MFELLEPEISEAVDQNSFRFVLDLSRPVSYNCFDSNLGACVDQPLGYDAVED